MRLNTEHSRLQDILCEEYAVVDIVVHILTVYVRKDIIICIILLYYSNKIKYLNLAKMKYIQHKLRYTFITFT